MDVVQSQRKILLARKFRNSNSNNNTMTTESESRPTDKHNNNNNNKINNDEPMVGSATASSRPGLFSRFRRNHNNNNNNDQIQNHIPQRRMSRSRSAPAAPGRRARRRLLMEDHFNVRMMHDDNGDHASAHNNKPLRTQPMVLPGVPHHDPDWARDSHDFFNLIVLIPVVALNIMNWNWDYLAKLAFYGHDGQFSDAWTGEWFQSFFFMTVAYFIVDLAWILLVPACVKSPATIIQHHVATILYIMIPYTIPEYQWCMGACMSVEVNTWFLIARRVFNRQGFPPWIIDLSFVSIRVKLISVLFYVTWIAIRCIVYPYLMPCFIQQWLTHSQQVGTKWNIVALSVPLHAAFCLLNLKWTYDLFTSKIRFWTRKNKSAKETVDKGL